MDCLNLESHTKCLGLVLAFALEESRKVLGVLTLR